MSEDVGMTHASVTDQPGTRGLHPKRIDLNIDQQCYTDLDHLDDFAGSTLRINRRGALSFRTQRHLCDDQHPSETRTNFCSITVDNRCLGSGETPTNPHCFGIGFNPLSCISYIKRMDHRGH